MALSSPVRILAVNSGSSSLKYALWEIGAHERRLFAGNIGSSGKKGARALVEALAKAEGLPALIGHRIVHGGENHVAPERITPRVLRDLHKLAALDPEHLPPAFDVIAALLQAFPRKTHYACFDTAFHRDLPEVARCFPIPLRYYHAGIRRFGFHGLSYAYLLEELARVGGRKAAQGRVLLAHLGSGASLAAVRKGKPIDTTMGFMPSGGLMMATRSGDLDPGVILHLVQNEWRRRPGASARNKAAGSPPQRLSAIVNEQSGMLGVSGYSGDVRKLMARGRRDRRCALALEMFIYIARKQCGALIAALGGVDTIVFSGGIGEHAPEIRAGIAAGLGFAGVTLDPARNRRSAAVISAPGAPITVRVIATDEERMIARAGARIFA